MTNTPQQPDGPGPEAGQPQKPLFAPEQPSGQPGGYPQPSAPYAQQPYGQPGAYPQQPYAAPGPSPFPGQPAQPYAQAPIPSASKPSRPARPKTDPSGVPYGVGPFTLREAIFLGATALVLIASFLPFLSGEYADVFGYASAWAPAGWLIVPAALVLVAAAALIAVRRLTTVRRLSVGSLSVDQFASAASVVTAGFYLGALFLIAGFPTWFGGGSDILEPGAGVIVGLLFSLVAVAVTTLSPALPFFSPDFSRRQDVGSHPIARPASHVPRRPRAERPTPAPQQPVRSPDAPSPQAGPGEYAAYKRKGSPQEAAIVDAGPVAEPADTTRALPTDGALPAEGVDEPQTFAPDFVATDVPAVDPRAVPAADPRAVPAAAPHDAGDVDDERDDDALAGTSEQEGPAPVSAFSHVSARTAAASADVSPASGDSGAVAEAPTAVFSTQPFWVYSPVSRPVVDEVSGATVFEIGPSAWALAILDRGTELVIRHDDGRVGVLQNLEGITRG
jgi:hypothetical protein